MMDWEELSTKKNIYIEAENFNYYETDYIYNTLFWTLI